jgi:hypothetical protein
MHTPSGTGSQGSNILVVKFRTFKKFNITFTRYNYWKTLVCSDNKIKLFLY